MAEPVTDLLMMLSLTGKEGVPAESVASVNSRAALNDGFTAGRYFDLQEFGFGMKLEPKEGKPAPPPGQIKPGGSGVNANSGVAVATPAENDFAVWRSVKAGEDEPVLPYKCKPEAFTIKRQLDAATPVLFAHCAQRQSFQKAVIIKRYRGVGDADPSSTSSGPATMTFLRMEFGEVLLTSMDWSDGDIVTETCRFTFQSFAVTAVAQKADGTAGVQNNATWTGPKKTASVR